MNDTKRTVLFVVNYTANTGYAWDYFERLFARIADRLAPRGVRTYVAYPRIPSPPRTLEGSEAEAVELDASLDSRASRRATTEFVRDREVDLVYYTDRATRRWAYALLRRAGVRHIIVADHTSGARTRPRGLKRWLKTGLARLPAVTADRIVTPSDYVARRQTEVVMNPPEKVRRIYYGFSLDRHETDDRPGTHEAFGLEEGRPVVACACRAAPEKGVTHLLRGFDRMRGRLETSGPKPVLVYCGDGPQMEELRQLRESLASREDILLAGYKPGAVPLLRDARMFVMPSVWQDALPLAVMEPMSLGKPVVSTTVGGIPEMIEDGISGLLVPPEDEAALAEAMEALLRDPELAERLGRAARRRVAEKFSPERELDELTRLLEEGLGLPTADQPDRAALTH